MGTDHSKLIDRSNTNNTLVSLLLREDWDAVCERIKQHPKEATAQVKLNIPTTLYFPLHVACGMANVPLKVVKALVEADSEGPLRQSVAISPSSARQNRLRTFSHSSAVSAGSLGSDSSSGTSSNVHSDPSLPSGVLSGDLVGWLPLHVAVFCGVSLEVIEFLVDTCPSSVVCKTGQGFLPLHLACQKALEDSSRLNIVEFLLEAFPTSRFVPSSCENGKTALEFVKEKEDVSPELLLLLQGKDSTPSKADEPASPPSPRSPRHSISLSDVVLQSILSEPTSPAKKRWSLGKQISVKPNDPQKPTKLVLLVTSRRWSEALERLAKHPNEAKAWTLCNAARDPPCHSLPLHMALRRKAPLNVIQALVENYPESVYAREFYGMLPLHVSCQSGCTLEVVRYLMEQHSVAVRAPDLTGLYPLHLACLAEGCRHPVVTYLLDAYPDAMMQKDDKGFLPEDYVRNGNHPHQRLLLSEFSKGVEYWAAQSSELGTLVCSRQWGAVMERLDTHPQEASIWTKHPRHGRRRFALHMACRAKAPSHVVERLLELCPEAAEVPIDDFRLVPLHLAAQYSGSVSTVQALLRVFPDAASLPDSHGLLPLHLAITEGASFDVVQALVDAFPGGVVTQDKKGFTPIVYAESSFHPRSKKVLELLKSARVDIGADAGIMNDTNIHHTKNDEEEHTMSTHSESEEFGGSLSQTLVSAHST